MRSFFDRQQRDRRSFAASFAVSVLIHAAVLIPAVLIVPTVRSRATEEGITAAAVSDEVFTIVWPAEMLPTQELTTPPVQPTPEPAVSAARDHDPGIGEPGVGEVSQATDVETAAGPPMGDPLPPAEGFGVLADQLTPRTPTPDPAAGLLGVGAERIEAPDIRVVADGLPDSTGVGGTGEQADEQRDGKGSGLGAFLGGVGKALGGIKVSMGGMGGGGTGEGGLGGRGKGGCVPGVGGIIGKRPPGTTTTPQGPDIRTGIGGRDGPMRGRVPRMPMSTTSCSLSGR